MNAHEDSHETHNNDNDTKAQEKQAKNSTVSKDTVGSRGKIEYNMPEVRDFFDLVFRDIQPDEHILGFISNTNRPSYPSELSKILNKVERTGLAKVCYFGTSTVVKHEDGKVYNRKSQFKRLHVVVLDDIGTKINEAALPPDLVPNYIIETSEGNYQWGFILETPIDNYDLAETLIHLVYTSGYSDEGGKMPTKAVRMPCGINGKKGDRGDFEVRLISSDDDYWTPDELLDVLDVGIKWADVIVDVNTAKHGKSARFTGTSMWSPIRANAASLSGVIDPVLEWLYENEMVVNDNGDWVAIKCPWSHEHTDGNAEAGYSPIGRGGQTSNRRGFNCFHGHCADKTTQDFLQLVSEESGIQAPLIDNVADLVADYAYVASEDAAYRVRGVNKPTGMKIGAFKNVHCQKVAVYDHTGKEKMIAESSLWLSSPNRLIVQGITHDPSSREKVVVQDGLRYLNSYAEPQWGSGAFNQEDVDTFKQFLEYLIPTETERDYFTQWLAAKAQDPTFKGAAVLMVAPTQGTGRTTLTDMVTDLFTSNNVKKVTFPQLCNATEAGAYNDYMDAGILTCDEIMSHTQNKHKVYEGLKDLFDPRPKSMVVNTKYGAQRSIIVYAAYLLLTNHADAIGSLGGDRRVYVIQNTLRPESHEYFVELNRWLKIGTWTRNVWRWLQTLEPDLVMLHAPTPKTSGKDAMIEATSSEVDIAPYAILEYFGGLIPITLMSKLARDIFDYREDSNAENLSKVVVSKCKSMSTATNMRGTYSGKRSRLRISNEYLSSKGINIYNDSMEHTINADLNDKFEAAREKISNARHQAIIEISDMLDEMAL
jgi:hypothetical protein